jgi:hypothetical protein
MQKEHHGHQWDMTVVAALDKTRVWKIEPTRLV